MTPLVGYDSSYDNSPTFAPLPCEPCVSFRRHGQGRRLRRHPDLRDGLRALHPRRGHRHPMSHEDVHTEDSSQPSCTKALQVPPQETGNRK